MGVAVGSAVTVGDSVGVLVSVFVVGIGSISAVGAMPFVPQADKIPMDTSRRIGKRVYPSAAPITECERDDLIRMSIWRLEFPGDRSTDIGEVRPCIPIYNGDYCANSMYMQANTCASN